LSRYQHLRRWGGAGFGPEFGFWKEPRISLADNQAHFGSRVKRAGGAGRTP